MSQQWLKQVGDVLAAIGCQCDGEDFDTDDPFEHTSWACRASVLLSIIDEQDVILSDTIDALRQCEEENTSLRGRLAAIASLLPGGDA